MSRLKNILKAPKEIINILVKDRELQKLLIIDNEDVEDSSFIMKTADELMKDGYIYTTAQRYEDLEDTGRNTFIVVVIQHISFENEEEDNNTSVVGDIFIATHINNANVKNYQDRGLLIADRIDQILNSLKLSAASQIAVKFITRLTYDDTLTGWQLQFEFNDLKNNEIEF